jgi:fused signal recognition particle receptor
MPESCVIGFRRAELEAMRLREEEERKQVEEERRKKMAKEEAEQRRRREQEEADLILARQMEDEAYAMK